jgi:hypothetical protein
LKNQPETRYNERGQCHPKRQIPSKFNLSNCTSQKRKTAIRGRAEAILGGVIDASALPGADGARLFSHVNHQDDCPDRSIPALTAILSSHGPIDIEGYAGEIQQSWGFPACRDALTPSCQTLLVTEMMTSLLSPSHRCKSFHGVLQSVVEHTRPRALVFRHAQQVVEPDAYLATVHEPPIRRKGSVNVRLFNISDSDGAMLMDTRGLHGFGLPDFQCHFRGLDPNQVSRVLFDAAYYIFETGTVIESGHTIAGIEPDSKWTCQLEHSLVGPARTVIDLNPGHPYAAGKRH